ncbi:hypothetical protein L228DRAFT_266612 [Xylona heveae TC161]|uniref:Uncharacterized protein n=1 Tax=Xylona heveae (strain CBS 132557 / TC161) TaxID=1328760 RepID=A0A165I2C5_XYLHT|nr:hypothetical protein L228DRAFT_266612 [Xylona heveae TC161]KZF24265.1 hypothetical protein L228DRAFT_266612 [Xylona heveae TC161]
MAALNAVGGPVGGMPVMNNGAAGVPRPSNASAVGINAQHVNTPEISRMQLNTYIYDYFLKNELYDCARALLQSDANLNTTPPTKTSPGRRRQDGNVNGVDENAMDTDSKDDVKRPDDLPTPNVPPLCPGNSFLFDWWCLFWDIFHSQRRKPKPSGGGPVEQYMQHTQQQTRMRQEQQSQLMRQMNPGMMPNMQYQNMMMRGMQANGMNLAQNELQRKALQNSRNATPQQMAKTQQQMLQQQMQRDNSDLDINGQPRPPSPSSGENAPSPSKRPRLDGTPFNGQAMGPNGRGQPQGMPGQPMNNANAAQLLIQNGINPGTLTQSQFQSFQQQNPAVQQKSITVYAQNLANHQRTALNNQTLQKGLPNPNGVPTQGSPMMQQGADPQGLGSLSDFYAAGSPAQMRGMQAPNGQGGNHALQDYQMQLMLLEQQNKKRLLLARHEQDSQNRDGQPIPGQPGMVPPGMSPQGSRSGPSPTPNEMKLRTPKIGGQAGLPGSPLPDGTMPQARGSPAAMNFNPAGQIPPEMAPQFYHQVKAMGENITGAVPNGAVMRPPSSHPQGFANPPLNQQQLEAMARQQSAARLPSGNWQPGPQGAPMMQQPPPNQQQQPQPMGTPQQRNAMPPPQAPAGGGAQTGRTQPSSPQQPAAPPTPQQQNKANPKSKKDAKEPRKRTQKKGAANTTAATPSSEAEPPPTPTPSTPITPVHPNSFNANQQKGQVQPATAAAPAAQQPAAPPVPPSTSHAPTSAPVPAPPAAPQPDPSQVAPFGSIDGSDNAAFNLDFSSLDSTDVLESFDFDSFLNTDDQGGNGAFSFDPGLGYGNPDGVEAGTEG